MRPHERVPARGQAVDRLVGEPGAGPAGDRPAEDHRVDDRDGEEHGADQQQPALQVAARAERRDQGAAEAGREQADEPAAGVDEVPDVRPNRAAVAGLQGLVGRIGGPA